MKILLTGATGFIGTELVRHLLAEGHELKVITRNRAAAQNHLGAKPEFIEHDLNESPLQTNDFHTVDAVINLAGESIQGRWTAEKKNRIMQSRKNVADNLLRNLPKTVSTLITVSAQGIYGDRGAEILTENSSAGEGFLAEVCKNWEAQLREFKGNRLVILRLGMVLAPQGGALKKLLGIFRKNLGAALGDGRQWMSFISLNDLVHIFSEALANESYAGVINVVTDQPITNKDFSAELCRHLHVLQLPRVPAFVLKLSLGEMSELVLSSQRVSPDMLKKLKFKFNEPGLVDVFNRYLT